MHACMNMHTNAHVQANRSLETCGYFLRSVTASALEQVFEIELDSLERTS